MKFGELKSIGHNIADSFASGIGQLVGFYQMDVFREAKESPEGYITVDFLNGTSSGGKPSPSLARAIELYRDALAELCDRHGASPSDFSELTVKFTPDIRWGRFEVTVAGQDGRRSIDEYVGAPGRRVKKLDERGRVRGT